jgi:hypothetical protein
MTAGAGATYTNDILGNRTEKGTTLDYVWDEVGPPAFAGLTLFGELGIMLSGLFMGVMKTIPMLGCGE